MLILSRLFHEQIYAHAGKHYPFECCGALMGSINKKRRVNRVIELNNIKAQQNIKKSYSISPSELWQLNLQAERTGSEIIGFYHSHPDGINIPSETDRAMAWDSYSYLIITLRKADSPQFRSWRLKVDGSGFEEELIFEN